MSSNSHVDTVTWHDGCVRMIDQTLLPVEEVILDCGSIEAVAEAIESLRVRGAPAIGVTAGYGLALAAKLSAATTRDALLADLAVAKDRLAATRPTAVNLFWALERVMAVAVAGADPDGIRAAVLAEAKVIHEEDIAMCRAMGRYGAELLPDGVRILTHCNAGALATAGYGTALGVIRSVFKRDPSIHVYADETRPFLQGSRLTAWELQQEGIPCSLITDNMSGYFFKAGEIDAVVVGSDRIAGNGDVANKIGTYTVSVLAKEHGVPFYVAAPTSTVDLSLTDGSQIPIEERNPEEVTHCGARQIAPTGIGVRNPAFDVTPHQNVAAIITEMGVHAEPYTESLAAAKKGK